MAKPGEIVKVTNTDKSPSEKAYYHAVWVRLKGEPICLMFTEKELKKFRRGESKKSYGTISFKNDGHWYGFNATQNGIDTVICATASGFETARQRAKKNLGMQPTYLECTEHPDGFIGLFLSWFK